MSIILQHLKEHWDNHLAAGSASGYTWMHLMGLQGFSMAAVLQGMLVGVGSWVIISLLKGIFKALFHRETP